MTSYGIGLFLVKGPKQFVLQLMEAVNATFIPPDTEIQEERFKYVFNLKQKLF